MVNGSIEQCSEDGVNLIGIFRLVAFRIIANEYIYLEVSDSLVVINEANYNSDFDFID